MRVIVLGAGVTGITTAYYLTKDGHEVTVIDRKPGAGLETSFANGGIVCRLTASPWASPNVPKMLLKYIFRDDAPYTFRLRPDFRQMMWAIQFLKNCRQSKFEQSKLTALELAEYSFLELEKLRSSEDIEYDRRAEGMIELYKDERSLELANKSAKTLPDKKYHPQMLSIQETIDIEPALTNKDSQYKGALFYSGEETGDAYKFTSLLAERTQQLGAKFCYGENVDRIIINNFHASGIATNKDQYAADAIVVSLGSFSSGLLRQCGIKLPIFPLKGYSITIPIEGQNTAPTHGVHDISRRVVFSRLGNRLRCAGTAELTGFDLSINKKRIDLLTEDAQRVFPDCTSSGSPEPWAGLRPMTPDCLPIIGESRIKNLYLNTGHGSTGWTWSCGSARAISDIINGNFPDINISGLDPERFN
tara:strand:- start:3204 stop:4457 length:1254 start_codon:yes stop_codon:yes gene_type:complete